jgi:hypothetical protein
MLFLLFYIPFQAIVITILVATKSYLTLLFIFIAGYFWYRALSEKSKLAQMRNKEILRGNILVFKKEEVEKL